MKRQLLFPLIVLCGLVAIRVCIPDVNLIAQTVDSNPRQLRSGSSNPATCTVGQVFFNTTTAGSNLYGCTATNTWTVQGGSNGAVTLISDQLLGSAVATVTFSSISGYKHLKLVVESRCSAAAVNDNIYIQVNGDTATNYSTDLVQGNNATVLNVITISSAKAPAMYIPCANAAANWFNSADIQFSDYLGTTANKQANFVSGGILGSSLSSANIYTYNGLWGWSSNAAITSILLGVSGGSNFITGSRFTLYGLN